MGAGSFRGRPRMSSVLHGNALREHLCSAHSFPPRSQRRIGWLHVPKTGTSFMNTVLHHSCDLSPGFEDLSVSHFIAAEQNGVDDHGTTLAPTLNNAWVHVDRLLNVSQRCFAARLVDRGRRVILSTNRKQEGGSPMVGWRPHIPLPAGSHHWESSSSYGRIVSLFRRPAQRLASAFHHAGGPHGVAPPDRRHVTSMREYVRYCPGGGSGLHETSSIQCVRHKQCAYVIGRPCAHASDAREAIERLRGPGLAFVGLTEFWDVSVCLFHRLLGQQPHPVEFEPTRVGPARPNGGWYDELSLFKGMAPHELDAYDHELYVAAAARFVQLVQSQTGSAVCEIQQEVWTQRPSGEQLTLRNVTVARAADSRRAATEVMLAIPQQADAITLGPSYAGDFATQPPRLLCR